MRADTRRGAGEGLGGAHRADLAHVEVDPVGDALDGVAVRDAYERRRVLGTRVKGSVDVLPRRARVRHHVREGLHGHEDGVVELRAGGKEVSVNRAFASEDGESLSVCARHCGADDDASAGQRRALAFSHPGTQHEIVLRLKADDPPRRPIGERLGHIKLVGHSGDVLVGGHARQGRARLVTAHGGPEHQEALLVHLVQAARRIDNEVGAEPAYRRIVWRNRMFRESAATSLPCHPRRRSGVRRPRERWRAPRRCRCGRPAYSGR